MNLMNILKQSKAVRVLGAVALLVSASPLAQAFPGGPQSALNHIYRADTLIVQGDVYGARNEIYGAISDLQVMNNGQAYQAINYLNQASSYVGYDTVRARDLLNSGESIVESMVQFNTLYMPTRQVLKDALDRIYVTDTRLVQGNNSSARSNIQQAINLLSPYSAPEMRRAVQLLQRTYNLVGGSVDKARTALNDAETIVERALGQ